MKTKTEFLSDWEVLAVERAIEVALEHGIFEPVSGEALLEKVRTSSHIRLSYMSTST